MNSNADIQSALRKADSVMNNCKMKIEEILMTVEKYKSIECTNTNFEEDYNNMMNDISTKLGEALNELTTN